MSKSFFNKSRQKIQFGAGNVVEPGAAIKLDDETLKKKSQAIKSLIDSGDIVEGTKDKDAPKEKEPEEEPEEKDEKPEDEKE